MNLGIENKRALVIGGGRGLGRGIAETLAKEGVTLTIAGRTESKLADAAQLIAATGAMRPTILACDVSKLEDIDRLIAAVKDTDILVNNCGGPPSKPLLDVNDQLWIDSFNSIFMSMMRLTRGFVGGMRERKWGRVLNIVSSGVIQPIPNLGISNSLRSAVCAWSKTLATEIASDGVTINCLAPGRIHTDRIDELDQTRAKHQGMEVGDVQKASRAAIPAKRYGEVQEFANMAAFLASDRASYITGSIHRIDGGLISSV
jgi:3-oxoacyl-[acyl-carrier protein] reductase